MKISFYKHEVLGASITERVAKELGWHDDEAYQTANLVRNHQFRFYKNSKDTTIIRWMEKLGSGWKDVFTLREADRLGNDINKDKPLVPRKTQELLSKCLELEHKCIFYDELNITVFDFKELGILRKFWSSAFAYLTNKIKTKECNNNYFSLIKAARQFNEELHNRFIQ
ncbi:MAG: hypothetical protein WBQ32_08845 [Ignavibacteriaceae bacterium]